MTVVFLLASSIALVLFRWNVQINTVTCNDGHSQHPFNPEHPSKKEVSVWKYTIREV